MNRLQLLPFIGAPISFGNGAIQCAQRLYLLGRMEKVEWKDLQDSFKRCQSVDRYALTGVLGDFFTMFLVGSLSNSIFLSAFSLRVGGSLLTREVSRVQLGEGKKFKPKPLQAGIFQLVKIPVIGSAADLVLRLQLSEELSEAKQALLVEPEAHTAKAFIHIYGQTQRVNSKAHVGLIFEVAMVIFTYIFLNERNTLFFLLAASILLRRFSGLQFHPYPENELLSIQDIAETDGVVRGVVEHSPGDVVKPRGSPVVLMKGTTR